MASITPAAGCIPVRRGGNWDFWLGGAERGWRFRYVPEVLFDYRIRANARSSWRDPAEWRAPRRNRRTTPPPATRR